MGDNWSAYLPSVMGRNRSVMGVFTGSLGSNDMFIITTVDALEADLTEAVLREEFSVAGWTLPPKLSCAVTRQRSGSLCVSEQYFSSLGQYEHSFTVDSGPKDTLSSTEV